MKKVFSILLVVAMLACFMLTTANATEAATASVSGSAESGKTGETVTMSVSIGNNPGFRSYKIVLNYDSAALEVVSVNGDVTSNTRNAGKIIVTDASQSLVTGNVELFSVTFKVTGTCGTYPVSVAVEELLTKSAEGVAEKVPYTTSNGMVTVNHNWVKGQTVDPTCTTDGYTVYTCSACGATDNRDTVKGGHKPAAAVKENVVGATCTAGGSYDEVVYCSVCNAELSRETNTIGANGHVPGDEVIENKVDATCAKAGSYDKVVYCSVCNAEISRETIVVPTVDHVYKKADGSWNYGYDDTHHWYECINCGHKTERVVHDHCQLYDGFWWCECGHKGPAYVDDGKHDDVIETGNMGSYVAFGAVALISMAAAATYVFKRKFAK